MIIRSSAKFLIPSLSLLPGNRIVDGSDVLFGLVSLSFYLYLVLYHLADLLMLLDFVVRQILVCRRRVRRLYLLFDQFFLTFSIASTQSKFSNHGLPFRELYEPPRRTSGTRDRS